MVDQRRSREAKNMAKEFRSYLLFMLFSPESLVIENCGAYNHQSK